MASYPARQPSQPRRASPEQASQPSRSSSSPVRTRSEDSQTLFLNKPDDHNTTTVPSDEQTQQQATQPPTATSESASEPNKCWICFADSTEDTPETSPWRSPCSCNLVAHEECLLDWIADMEAPNNRRSNRAVGPPKIQCPQCKTEIKLSRPTDLVVEAVRRMERLGGQLITPGAVAILLGTVYHSSMFWGIQSIFAVFGVDDGFRILGSFTDYQRPPPIIFDDSSNKALMRQIVNQTLHNLVHHLQRWRLHVGVPLITPMLILSRTTIADSILPIMPILFFATQTPAAEPSFDFTSWPPSASLAFSVLPYIRQAYNVYYRRVWAPKERQWLKEIQPRVNQEAANAGNGDRAEDQQDVLDPLAPQGDNDNILDIRIDADIWEEWEDDGGNDEDAADVEQRVDAVMAEAANPRQEVNLAQPNAQQEGQPQANDQQEPQRGQQVNQQQGQQQGGQQPQRAQQPAAAGERRLSYSVTAIAETVLGALMFPTIAGISGELLRLCLPRSWTAPTMASGLFSRRLPAKGLLQEKWGRSLVGGCLFVVLKDAVMLYVRWRMAQMHRNRKVLDYTGTRRAKA